MKLFEQQLEELQKVLGQFELYYRMYKEQQGKMLQILVEIEMCQFGNYQSY